MPIPDKSSIKSNLKSHLVDYAELKWLAQMNGQRDIQLVHAQLIFGATLQNGEETDATRTPAFDSFKRVGLT